MATCPATSRSPPTSGAMAAIRTRRSTARRRRRRSTRTSTWSRTRTRQRRTSPRKTISKRRASEPGTLAPRAVLDLGSGRRVHDPQAAQGKAAVDEGPVRDDRRCARHARPRAPEPAGRRDRWRRPARLADRRRARQDRVVRANVDRDRADRPDRRRDGAHPHDGERGGGATHAAARRHAGRAAPDRAGRRRSAGRREGAVPAAVGRAPQAARRGRSRRARRGERCRRGAGPDELEEPRAPASPRSGRAPQRARDLAPRRGAHDPVEPRIRPPTRGARRRGPRDDRRPDAVGTGGLARRLRRHRVGRRLGRPAALAAAAATRPGRDAEAPHVANVAAHEHPGRRSVRAARSRDAGPEPGAGGARGARRGTRRLSALEVAALAVLRRDRDGRAPGRRGHARDLAARERARTPRGLSRGRVAPRPRQEVRRRSQPRPRADLPVSRAVGIDLGTTNSVVALIDKDGAPRILTTAEGSTTLPSLVWYAANGPVVGERARAGLAHSPACTIFGAKRLLGRRFDHPEIRRLARTLPFELTEAPNGDTWIQLAAGRAIAPEEVCGLLVRDLGGGTFDVATVDGDAGVFEVLATTGDPFLGGDDLDRAIVAHQVLDVRQARGIDISGDAIAIERLRLAAQRAKHELSDAERTKLAIQELAQLPSGRGVEYSRLIRRDELELWTSPLVRKIEAPLLEALSRAGRRLEDVEEVLLVGGSTRMPAVR